MDLIERYVADVGRRLPAGKRADIQAELTATLRDALEARGQNPTETDVVELLREFGPPVKVAASYNPSGQYLIGPELYPTFLRVLRVTFILLGTLMVVAFAARAIIAQPAPGALADRFAEVLGVGFRALLSALGIITLVFAGIQRLEVAPPRKPRDWNPLDLPAVRDRDRIGRADAVAGAVAPAIGLVFLNAFAGWIAESVGTSFRPVVDRVLIANLPWLNGVLVLQIALYGALLLRGHWCWVTRVGRIAAEGFGLYVFIRVASHLAGERSALEAAGLTPALAGLLIRSAYVWVAVSAVIAAVGVGRMLVRWIGRPSIPSGMVSGNV